MLLSKAGFECSLLVSLSLHGRLEFLDDDLLDINHLLTVISLHLPMLDFL